MPISRFLAPCLVAAFISTSAAAAPPVPGIDRPAFGAQSVWPNDPNLELYLDRMQEAGIKWGRFDFCWWSLAENPLGTFDFDSPNVPGYSNWNTGRALQLMRDRDIEPFPILAYSHPQYDNESGPFTDAGREAFGRYCFEAASRYRDQVNFWEVWNEPNLQFFWGRAPHPEDYAKLTEVAARRIREADPTAVIVGGVTSGIDNTFLAAAFQAGLLNHVDAITVHPYRLTAPETIGSEIATLRSLIATHAPGRDIPIWTGEWGYNTAWTQVTELGQAKALQRMFVNNMSLGIDLSIWFSTHPFVEEPSAPTDPQWGLVDYSFNRRPSWYAMQAMNQRLKHPIRHIADPFQTTVTGNQSGVRREYFYQGSPTPHTTMAVWRTSWPTSDTNTPRSMSFSFALPAATSIRGYDGITNNELTLSLSEAGGRTTISNLGVRDYPIFIDIAAAAPERATLISVDAPKAVSPGSTFPVTLRWLNQGPATWESDVVLGTSGPRDRQSPFQTSGAWISGNRVAALAQPIAAGQTGTMTFTATAPGAAGVYTESFELLRGANGWIDGDQASFTITVSDDFSDWSAVLHSAPLPSILEANRVYTVSVSYRNVGAQAWNASTLLGTSNPRDSTSPLWAWSWPKVNRPGGLVQTSVPYNALGEFQFDVIAPSTPGVYTLPMELVQENISWFEGSGDNITWNLQVTKDPNVVWIEVENFDDGPAGVAYSDTEVINYGGMYRNTGVDLARSTEGGMLLGWTEAGEWLRFSNVQAIPGVYTVEARVASWSTGGGFALEVNGANQTGTVNFPATGDWQTWTTVSGPQVQLDATNNIRLLVQRAGWNISWIKLTRVAPGDLWMLQ